MVRTKRCDRAMRLACLISLSFGLNTAIADLERAQLLYDAQLYDDAKRELVVTATSDAPAEEKASALHLLGTIAVDEKRYDAAVRTWSDLISKYPDTQDALLVGEKIPLVQTMARQDDIAPPPVEEASPQSPELSGVVLVGAGPETVFVDLAVDEISNFLIGGKVGASKAPEEQASLAELMPVANQTDVSSFLVLTLKFGYLESLRAECYAVDGELQWKEKASGSFGFGKERITTGLVERMKEKLEDRLGDSCLPLTG